MFAPLCEPLYDAFEWAAEQAHERRDPYLKLRIFDWLGTHMTRAYAYQRLTTTEDLGGWKLTGDHRRNGELWLTNGTTRTRLLHTNSASEVPRAGHNTARRAYYRNPPLFDLPGQLALDLTEDSSRLLTLWRVVNPATFEVAIRVVRPLGEGTTRKASRVDLDFMLPRAEQDMLNQEWFPSDEDMDIRLPGEDDEEASGDADGLLG